MARFGMRLNGGLPFTTQDMLEMTSLAEERGYEAIWLPEAIGSDALTQLTFLATATRRIKLGTGILPIFYRTPTLLAMSAGSLNDISRGDLFSASEWDTSGLWKMDMASHFADP